MKRFQWAKHLLLGGLLASVASGCSVKARHSIEVQTAISQSSMRRLETDHLIVYYPEGTKARTLRIAARLEGCRQHLESYARVDSGAAAEKSVFILPLLPFNNAYAAPGEFGSPAVSLVPQFYTSTVFAAMGVLPDPSAIGCHEMVHAVQSQQISEFPALLRQIFGPVATPQSGFDSWFWEGLAVYYETKLQNGGRLDSNEFEGTLAAGVAGKGIGGGMLSSRHREPRFGANYLVGSHFVQYLVEHYGEKRLWELIGRQSDATFFLFGVGKRFENVFGKSLNDLTDDFSKYLKAQYPVRTRPPVQRRLRRLGREAIFAQSLQGQQITITSDLDSPLRLHVHDSEGQHILTRRLTDWGPVRDLVRPSISGISGLSLTKEGRHAYFVAIDPGEVFSEARLVHLDVEHDKLEVLEKDLGGSGGSVSPDGTRYFYSKAVGDSHALYVYDLKTGKSQALTEPEPRNYLMSPQVSPDGKRLLVLHGSNTGYELTLVDAESGTHLQTVATPPGVLWAGSWSSGQSVVYPASDGQRKQIFETHLNRKTFRKVSEAPYLAGQPYARGDTLHFLNREDWHWTLDEAQYLKHTPVTALAPVAAHQSRDRPLRVLSDEEYSGVEDLFQPTSWYPILSPSLLGANMAGGDRLSLHTWQVSGAWDFVHNRPGLASVNYINSAWAPLRVTLNALFEETRVDSYLNSRGLQRVAPLDSRHSTVDFSVTRSWYKSINLNVGARFLDSRYDFAQSQNSTGNTPEQDEESQTLAEYQFAGIYTSILHQSGESTAYGGKRLSLDVSGAFAFYPASLSGVDFDLADAVGRITTVVPLPLSKRHSLSLEFRGRALLGQYGNRPLLTVGGTKRSTPFLMNDTSRNLAPGLRFVAPLRGFENFVLFGQQAVLVEATYKLPLILDVGQPSWWKYLPSTFAQQWDIVLFASGASLLQAEQPLAMAAGGALNFLWNLGQAPLSSGFQLSRRLSHDHAWVFDASIDGSWDD